MAKLTAADVDKLIAEAAPKPQRYRSADDYIEGNTNTRLSVLNELASKSNTSNPRNGESFPKAPNSLRTLVETPKDAFGRLLDDVKDDEESGSRSCSTDLTTVEILPPVKREPIPRALMGVNFEDINCRTDLLMALTMNIPINEMGLPKIIYRGDLLDWTLFSGKTPAEIDANDRYREMQSCLDSATIYLSYAEGFPALPGGHALWGQLPFETTEQYGIFTEYCEMAGARQVSRLVTHVPEVAQSYFHEYYWAIRARCYDMMAQVHAAKMRERRIMACEDNHFLEASHMLQRLKKMENEVAWDALAEDPEAYVKVLEKVVNLQRKALGLDRKDASGVSNESVEIALRRIAEPSLPILKLKEDAVDVRQLLRNPDALASAQELIVQMTNAQEKARD